MTFIIITQRVTTSPDGFTCSEGLPSFYLKAASIADAIEVAFTITERPDSTVYLSALNIDDESNYFATWRYFKA